MSARAAAAVLALAALAACADPRTESEIRAAGWAPRDIVAATAPVYCYRTIGQPDCSAAPQAGQNYRYIVPQAPVARTP